MSISEGPQPPECAELYVIVYDILADWTWSFVDDQCILLSLD